MSKVETRKKGSGGRDESKEPALKSVREEIDRVDREVLRLLAERREKSLEAAHAKESQPHGLRDEAREEALLVARIQAGREVGLDSHYVTGIFQGILDDSLRVQQEYFQAEGERGHCRVAGRFSGGRGSL